MDVLPIAAGAAIIVIVLADVFFTVLYPASGRGPLRKPATAVAWGLFRLAARSLGARGRRALLCYAGPVIIAQTMVLWCALLIAGWALVFLPAMGGAVASGSGAPDQGWLAALYFSGFNFSTLGMGDIVPRDGLHRMLAIGESAIGFGLLTLAMTYFLSVYSHLTRRNGFAHGLHHRTGRSGDAAELIAGLALAEEGRFPESQLLDLQDPLREIYQSHHLYPVLRHFRYAEPFQALPRILLLCLDTVSLLRAGLDPAHYPRLADRPSLSGLHWSAMELVGELQDAGNGAAVTEATAAAWRQRFLAALPQLAEAGFAVREDAEAAARDYIAQRTAWDAPLRRLAQTMLYAWEEVDPVSRTQERADRV